MAKVFKNKTVDEPIFPDKAQPQASMPVLHRALQTGQNVYRVGTLDDIQKAINAARKQNGGTIFLQQGTHVVKSPLIGFSNIEIVGENSSNTIVSFSGSANLSFSGTDLYTDGTITSVTNGVNVTGSGTSWLANVTTDHQIFIGQRWYRIAAVTSDTKLILGEGFAGLGSLTSFPGVSYRAAKVIQGVEIKEVTFKDSTSTGITFDDCRNIVLEDIVVDSCNKGIVYTNSSELGGDRVIVVSSTSNGIEFQSSGFVGTYSNTPTVGNGGHGLVLNNSRVIPFSFSASNANTNDGVNITSCESVVINHELNSNGGEGVEVVSGSRNIIFENCLVDSNTSDGIKLTASADSCKILQSEITDNGGYGVNIAASSCDDTIVANNVASGNTTDSINDSGIGSVFSGNKGILDKVTEDLTNNSGSSLSAGDVVVLGGGLNPPPNGDLPQSGSVVSRWLLDESSGNALDNVGSNDLTDNNTVDSGSGLSETAAVFDNSRDFERDNSEYFDITDANQSGLDFSTAFTISGWVNKESGGVFMGFMSKSSSTDTDNAYKAQFDDTDKLDFFISDDGTNQVSQESATTFSNSTWYHIVLVYEASTRITIYVDGTQDAENTTGIYASLNNSAEPFHIGRLATNDFDGLMQDVIAWNVALTDAEVSDLYDLYTVSHSGNNLAGDSVTTTTTAGDDNVFGMAQETIADGSAGSILREGLTVSLKVNGTTDIAINDFLTTHSEAGIAAKGTTGDMVFAIAQEAYSTDDSNGVIDARLISPRKL